MDGVPARFVSARATCSSSPAVRARARPRSSSSRPRSSPAGAGRSRRWSGHGPESPSHSSSCASAIARSPQAIAASVSPASMKSWERLLSAIASSRPGGKGSRTARACFGRLDRLVIAAGEPRKREIQRRVSPSRTRSPIACQICNACRRSTSRRGPPFGQIALIGEASSNSARSSGGRS